jgi:CRP/FNR family transcriptional regulator
MPLSDTQIRFLRHLADAEEQAQSPTLRELMEAFGWSSIGSVQSQVRALCAKGLLVRQARKARSLRLTSLGRMALAQGGGSGRPPQEGFASAAQEMLEILAPWLQFRSYERGAILWREGDHADRLVMVDQGHLRAFRPLPDGRTATVLQFSPGEVLGFSPFFDEGGYPASVEALDAVRVRFVARQDLLRAIREPKVAMSIFRFLAQRLRKAFDVIERLSRHRALPRVAAALLGLAEGKDFQLLALPQSSKAFAESLGLAPATLSRAMAQLVRTGVLHRLGPRRYQLLQRQALARFADGEGI